MAEPWIGQRGLKRRVRWGESERTWWQTDCNERGRGGGGSGGMAVGLERETRVDGVPWAERATCGGRSAGKRQEEQIESCMEALLGPPDAMIQLGSHILSCSLVVSTCMRACLHSRSTDSTPAIA